jgi:arginine decarboxylase
LLISERSIFRLTLADATGGTAAPAKLMAFVAKNIFLTKGVGKHRERLSSFELALRNAGIAACNIVRVSSIFPPSCKLISRSEGLKHLKPGQVAFTVISENQTREPHRLIAAGVGLALPADKSMYGYLSEHHSFGESEEIAGEYTEELAAEMLATTLNVEFDPDLSWDEKKEVYRISNKIVRTMNITQSAVGDKRGLWTTVLAAAILLGEDD